jgi:hypothetical protein
MSEEDESKKDGRTPLASSAAVAAAASMRFKSRCDTCMYCSPPSPSLIGTWAAAAPPPPPWRYANTSCPIVSWVVLTGERC